MADSFATRLILWLSICSSAVLGCALFTDYQLSRAEIIDRVERESLDTIDRVLVDLEYLLDGAESGSLILARILAQRDYSLPGLDQMLKDVVATSPDIYGATIALNPELVEDPLGYAPYYYFRTGILTSADLRQGEQPYWERHWYRDAAEAGHPIWVEPYFDHEGGQALMTTYSVPVYRADPEGAVFLYGVVTADITLDVLQAYMQRLRLGDSGFGILLSRQGTILGGRNPSHLLKHFSTLLGSEKEADHWQRMLVQAQKGQVIERELACFNAPGRCFVRLGILASTGWPVAVIYSEQELLAPLYDFQLKTALLGALTIGVICLAVYFVSRRLTAPLALLAEASGEIARGNLGANLPRPRGNDEVARLVRSFDQMKRDLRAHISELEEATANRSRLEGELAAAREIQMAMLPGGGAADEHFGATRLWARVLPAKSVGGDYYCFRQQGEHLLFGVGDVSDKGVPAALFMAKAISALQQLAATSQDPGAILMALNDLLEEGNSSCMFVTALVGTLDLDSGELRYASGGHPAPLLLRGAACSPLEQEMGPALGLASGLSFHCARSRLQPGDRLVLYTDGIEEAFNEQGEMYGLERLRSTLAEAGGAHLARAGDAVFTAVGDFAGQAGQSDDITLLLLAYGEADQSRVLELTPGGQLVGRTLDWLQQQLGELEIDPDTGRDLLLVAEEMVSNVGKYAGLAPDAVIRLELRRNGSELAFTLSDPGLPFDPLSEGRRAELGLASTTAAVGGLGVHLITLLSDRQHYRREGERNILQVTKILRG